MFCVCVDEYDDCCGVCVDLLWFGGWVVVYFVVYFDVGVVEFVELYLYFEWMLLIWDWCEVFDFLLCDECQDFFVDV